MNLLYKINPYQMSITNPRIELPTNATLMVPWPQSKVTQVSSVSELIGAYKPSQRISIVSGSIDPERLSEAKVLRSSRGSGKVPYSVKELRELAKALGISNAPPLKGPLVRKIREVVYGK
jgi:hypothetical protein